MKNIILKNGLIGGFIAAAFMGFSVYSLMKNPTNFEPSYILGFSGMFIAFAFTFIGIKQYRDSVNNGVITFANAFKVALMISLIISTIYVLVWLIEYYNFYPDFMEKYTAFEIQKLQSSGLSATEIASKTTEMNQMKEWYKNPLYVIVLTYIEILPIGIIISLIAALVMKKKAN